MSASEQSVYIATNGTDVKIGRSVDPESRVKDLSVGSPTQIELLHTIPMDDIENSAKELEKTLHQACEAEGWRKNGEWFEKEAYYYISGVLVGIGMRQGIVTDYSGF